MITKCQADRICIFFSHSYEHSVICDLLWKSITKNCWNIFTADIFTLSLSFSAGDEGSGRPVSPPRPTQLSSCPPLSDASVLASRSRGQTDVWHPPFLFGSAYQAPGLPQGRASSVRRQKTFDERSVIFMDSHALIWTLYSIYRSCSQPLLSPTPTDLTAVATVNDWLKALRMERYQEEFDQAHLDTLDRVSMLTMEWVLMGICIQKSCFIYSSTFRCSALKANFWLCALHDRYIWRAEPLRILGVLAHL